MGDAVLTDPLGQTTILVDGARISEAFHNALDVETLSPEELGRRDAVAEPGGQAPGDTVNSEALCHPQIKLPSDEQGATASGQSPEEILPEVSAGTNLMMARKAARCIRFGT